MAQEEWLIELVVRADQAEVDAIVDRVGDVICIPADHPEPCTTPWTIVTTRVNDLDEPRRSELTGTSDD